MASFSSSYISLGDMFDRLLNGVVPLVVLVLIFLLLNANPMGFGVAFGVDSVSMTGRLLCWLDSIDC